MKIIIFTLFALYFTKTWAIESAPTSIDLYCETMTIAFFGVALGYKPPSSPEHQKKVSAAESEMLDLCKSIPVIGGGVKNLKEMTPQQQSLLSCIAMAEGMATAKASKNNDRALYSKLSQSRQFFEKACESNKKKFLRDMKENGPEYALRTQY